MEIFSPFTAPYKLVSNFMAMILHYSVFNANTDGVFILLEIILSSTKRRNQMLKKSLHTLNNIKRVPNSVIFSSFRNKYLFIKGNRFTLSNLRHISIE